MRFSTHQHKHDCGIDLHARTMYICILEQAGTVLLHNNVAATSEDFLRVTAPYREELVVAVECSFTGYWLSALCTRQGLAFVLGHALYRKALQGGKAKKDKLDSHKIAVVLHGGMRPRA